MHEHTVQVTMTSIKTAKLAYKLTLLQYLTDTATSVVKSMQRINWEKQCSPAKQIKLIGIIMNIIAAISCQATSLIG